MADYKLARAAEDDLQRIYEYGAERWGESAAERYYNALFDRFEEIAERPYSYPAVDHIRAGHGGAFVAWIASTIASTTRTSLK